MTNHPNRKKGYRRHARAAVEGRTLCGLDLVQQRQGETFSLPLARYTSQITCTNCLTIFYKEEK